jgi:hypothetical protein
VPILTMAVRHTSLQPTDGAVYLVFTADYEDPANDAWATETPIVVLSATVTPAIAAQLELGDRYILTLEPA